MSVFFKKSKSFQIINIFLMLALTLGVFWESKADNLSFPTLWKTQSYLLAQAEGDDAYDPFADYSEFDEDSDEEADIYFFKNGRFLTASLALAYRGFTQGMSKNYSPTMAYGVHVSYFFDMRLALGVSFLTGTHNVLIATDNTNYEGTLTISSLSFHLKYYLNTLNVTKGLADLNPYLLLGFTQHYRTYTLAQYDGYNRDSAMGFDGGGGLEIPLLRRKGFLGIYGLFHYVNFVDEEKRIIAGTDTLKTPINGDFIIWGLNLGLNF